MPAVRVSAAVSAEVQVPAKPKFQVAHRSLHQTLQSKPALPFPLTHHHHSLQLGLSPSDADASVALRHVSVPSPASAYIALPVLEG